ncbi:hypothetical protein C8Q74DRAFT_59116 [Fomes fomentarius]|nr:hypothetical protein C8Q74DRAFT_59116 [Fomes fomentarius]
MGDSPKSTSSTIRPVTIRQLLDATREHSSAAFRIGDVEVDHVSIVAHAITIRHFDSCILYTLEDGTSRGHITARQWRSDTIEDIPDDDQLYVHVVGQLDQKMSMGAQNVLNIRRIRRIVDQIADRLCCHLMETAYVTLYHERGPPTRSALASIGPSYLSIEPIQTAPVASPPTSPARATTRRSPQPVNVPISSESSPVRRIVQASPPPPPRQSTPGPSTPIGQVNQAIPLQAPVPITPIRQSALRSPTRDSTPENPAEELVVQAEPPTPPPKALPRPSAPTTRSARRQSGIKRDPYAHLTALQRAILLQILNSQAAEEGASMFAIVRGVSHHDVAADSIGKALDFLTNEGYIENTIDNSHYAIKTSRYPRSP